MTTMTKDNKNKVLNVPTLRFPEFSGEWEKCKVSDILDFYPTNSLSWEQLEYKYEGLYNLHYGLIHNCSSICINTRKIKLPTIKENNIPNNYTLCKNGDVAFADASEDTNDVAKCIEFINCNNDNVVCGLHTVHGRDNSEKTIVGFKGYAFSAQSFRHQIRRLAQGTKIYSINSKNFSECYIGIPSKEEQTKVSNLLYIIDERIQTQKKIIEDLKKLKKEISKQLLYRSDLLENKIKISDIGSIKNGYSFQSSIYNAKGEYKILTISNVTGDRHICTEGCNCILLKPTDLKKHQELVSGDILVSLTGNVGRVSLCTEGKYLLNQRVGLLQLKENINKEFIYQVIANPKFEQSMILCSQGAAQMNIGKEDIENFLLLFH